METGATHTRTSYAFEDGWPVESIDDFAGYGAFLVGLVEPGSTDVESRFDLIYRDRKYRTASVDELRELPGSLTLDGLQRIWACVMDGEDLSVTLLIQDEYGEGAKGSLQVEGTDRTRVEGLNVQLRQDAEGRVERIAEARRAAEAKEKERERQARVAGDIIAADFRRAQEREGRTVTRPSQPVPEAASSSPSRWERFRDSPWAVEVVGGLIAGLVVLVVGTLLLKAFGVI